MDKNPFHFEDLYMLKDVRDYRILPPKKNLGFNT